MPIYIVYNPQTAGVYIEQEMKAAYTETANKRKFRSFSVWVESLIKSGQLEIA